MVGAIVRALLALGDLALDGTADVGKRLRRNSGVAFFTSALTLGPKKVLGERDFRRMGCSSATPIEPIVKWTPKKMCKGAGRGRRKIANGQLRSVASLSEPRQGTTYAGAGAAYPSPCCWRCPPSSGPPLRSMLAPASLPTGGLSVELQKENVRASGKWCHSRRRPLQAIAGRESAKRESPSSRPRVVQFGSVMPRVLHGDLAVCRMPWSKWGSPQSRPVVKFGWELKTANVILALRRSISVRTHSFGMPALRKIADIPRF